EDDDLLTLRIPPQRAMPIGEWNASVIADTAHDQVIADQQRVFHRAGRNHARLADRAVDQHERERYPEPSDDFPLHALANREVGFLILFVGFFWISLHKSPSFEVAHAGWPSFEMRNRTSKTSK